MQSKTSSFKLIDRTIFIKNLKRCWPIWAGYLFFQFWLIPGVMYFDNALSFMVDIDTKESRLVRSILNDGISVSMWMAIFAGILFAMAIFSYLQNERACNLIHALPLTRETLYSTGLLSGMIFMTVPNIVIFVVSLLIAKGFGANLFGVLLQWFLMTELMSLFFFALGILCMVIVGNVVASAFAYAILIELVELVSLPVNQISKTLFYGLYGDLINIPDNSVMVLIPVRFFDSINYYSKQNEAGITYMYSIDRLGMYVITTIVVSALFIAAALVLYKLRKSESAGDMIAIGFLRPIFRWLFAICTGLLMTWMILETVFDSSRFIRLRPRIAVALLILLSILAHIIAEMIIRKSFRIFKGFWGKLGVFTATIIAATLVLVFVSKAEANRIISPENCGNMVFEMNGYSFEIDADDIEGKQDVYEIHKYLLNHSNSILNDLESAQYSNSLRITFYAYDVKGNEKKTLIRQYTVPNSQRELYGMIEKLVNKNAERMIMDKAINDDYILEGARLYTSNSGYGYDSKYGYYDLDDSQKLLDAVHKDFEAGNLTYEIAIGWSKGQMFGEMAYDNVDGGPVYELDFEFSYKNDYYDSFYSSYDMVHINEDCVYTMQAIGECELKEFEK